MTLPHCHFFRRQNLAVPYEHLCNAVTTTNLDLNVTMNKELIIDFMKNCFNQKSSIIHRENVENVDTYKYL